MKLAWIPMLQDITGGYGKIGQYLQLALSTAGVEFCTFREADWDWRVAVGGPRAWLVDRQAARTPDVIWHTMFEARPLPPDWAPVLNRCAAIWTPAAWNVEVFRESGVTAPIYVGGYGVDPAEFGPELFERRDVTDETYTFMWAGTSLGDGTVLGDRKGGDLVLAAFRKLNLSHSRLILKASGSSAIRRLNGDERIMLIADSVDVRHYAALLALADCFVYPSHGEGFGLQPLEAMAMGLPVIAPAYSVMTEFITPETALVLPHYGEEPAQQYRAIYEYPCVWARLKVDDVADRMQWCYAQRAQAAALGRQAAAHVAREWTWQQAGQRGRALLHAAQGAVQPHNST